MAQPSFLREPVTVPPRELIAGYRSLAARYREMAAVEPRDLAHIGLLEFSRHCEAAASALADQINARL